ncbi:hypothetical protein MNEG_16025 [Monoraphidium neglectum]|uniref:Uncharacterized protein n=1 Tax=Monoraphidium neglectum TaxID=145388 RepID=A0A0D2IVF6_9CHLO|nr:hypothetical protein MNEG_16025 [Monoraphidium neglectum]KIY91937.1 hypothetical protein MNEG_16025 [Monoraphidium neglectum]|eukprot:XP_013890957.1 hypothetical protein MNEG_16025 [Monoraphidium neglectum]
MATIHLHQFLDDTASAMPTPPPLSPLEWGRECGGGAGGGGGGDSVEEWAAAAAATVLGGVAPPAPLPLQQQQYQYQPQYCQPPAPAAWPPHAAPAGGGGPLLKPPQAGMAMGASGLSCARGDLGSACSNASTVVGIEVAPSLATMF